MYLKNVLVLVLILVLVRARSKYYKKNTFLLNPVNLRRNIVPTVKATLKFGEHRKDSNKLWVASQPY